MAATNELKCELSSRFQFANSLYSKFYEESDYKNVKQWPVLCHLSKEFFSSIHLVYVIGEGQGDTAFMISRDNKVFAIGNYAIKTRQMLDPSTPVCIEELTGKNIETFYFGSNKNIVAVDKDKIVYHSSGGPFVMVQPKHNVQMVHITCGAQLRYEMDNRNYLSMYWYDEPCHPGTVVKFPLGGPISYNDILQFKNTYYNCNILLRQGAVYVTSSHMCRVGQPFDNLQKPFGTKKIVHIACGFNFTAAIDNTGAVYECYYLDTGKLDDENRIRRISHIERAVNVAAIHSGLIRVAFDVNLQFFLWGLCTGINIATPIDIPHKSIPRIFLDFAYPRIMHQPQILQNSSTVKVKEDISSLTAELFDDPTTSDFVIRVQNDPIYVHRNILSLRSPYFQTMFLGDWKELKEKQLEDVTISYKVYKSFLRYLYTDVLTLPECETDDELISCIENLCSIGDMHMQDTLKKECIKLFATHINVATVLNIYQFATRNNFEELITGCSIFVDENLDDVVHSPVFSSLEVNEIVPLLKTSPSLAKYKTNMSGPMLSDDANV